MKMILAIVPPTRLEAVKYELAKVEVFRLTVMDVQGFGTTKGSSEGKSREAELTMTRRVQLLIGVNEDFIQPTIDAIKLGVQGEDSRTAVDGKIFVLPLLDCIRIRTGEHGSEAI